MPFNIMHNGSDLSTDMWVFLEQWSSLARSPSWNHSYCSGDILPLDYFWDLSIFGWLSQKRPFEVAGARKLWYYL